MVFDRTQRVRWAQPQRPQMPQLVSQALAVPETDAEYAERVAEERAAAGRRSAERARADPLCHAGTRRLAILEARRVRPDQLPGAAGLKRV